MTFIDNVSGRIDIAYLGNLTNILTIIGSYGTEMIVSRSVYYHDSLGTIGDISVFISSSYEDSKQVQKP